MLLNCHTYYSFCYGTISIDEILEELPKYGYKEFVISDINNTSACLDIIRKGTEKGLRPIAGIDFRNGVQQQYVAIAKNNEGFKEINEFLTDHLHEEKTVESIAPSFKNAFVIYPYSAYTGQELRDNEYIGMSTKDIISYKFLSSKISHDKLVILQSLSFLNKRSFNAHRLLRAIDKNVLLSMLPKEEQATLTEVIISKAELLEAFVEYPQIIKNTEALLANCNIHFDFGKFANKNLAFYTDSLANDMKLLRKECEKGIEHRYGNNPDKQVLERIGKELQIIEQMNFASYFLINWDIIKYAQRKNYYYVGRGSGSNSILAYLLRITDVDPIELDLYFERFINPHRANPPDFDLDFSWTDRDDVTRYIFERFGKDGKGI